MGVLAVNLEQPGVVDEPRSVELFRDFVEVIAFADGNRGGGVAFGERQHVVGAQPGEFRDGDGRGCHEGKIDHVAENGHGKRILALVAAAVAAAAEKAGPLAPLGHGVLRRRRLRVCLGFLIGVVKNDVEFIFRFRQRLRFRRRGAVGKGGGLVHMQFLLQFADEVVELLRCAAGGLIVLFSHGVPLIPGGPAGRQARHRPSLRFLRPAARAPAAGRNRWPCRDRRR